MDPKDKIEAPSLEDISTQLADNGSDGVNGADVAQQEPVEEAAQVENQEAEIESSEELGDESQELTQNSRKKKSGFVRKLEKKDKEIDALRSQLEELSTSLVERTKNAPTAYQPQSISGLEEPKEEEFPSYVDYLTAKSQYTAKRAVFEALAEINEAKQQQYFERARLKSVQEAQKRYGDYAETVQAAGRVFTPSPDLERAIKSSEHAGDVIYFLSKNLDYASNLNALRPEVLYREFARLEAKFEKQRELEGVGVNNDPVKPLPRPLKPVNSIQRASSAKKTYSDYLDKDGVFDTDAYQKAKSAGLAI